MFGTKSLLGKSPCVTDQRAGTMESSKFDGAFQAEAPRRAAPRRRPAEDDADGSQASPVRGAKRSGWGESGAKASAAPRRRREAAGEKGEERPAAEARRSQGDDEDDGPETFIPDLEDETANVAMQVMHPLSPIATAQSSAAHEYCCRWPRQQPTAASCRRSRIWMLRSTWHCPRQPRSVSISGYCTLT